MNKNPQFIKRWIKPEWFIPGNESAHIFLSYFPEWGYTQEVIVIADSDFYEYLNFREFKAFEAARRIHPGRTTQSYEYGTFEDYYKSREYVSENKESKKA